MEETRKDDVEKKPRVEHVKGQPHPKLKQSSEKAIRVVETSDAPLMTPDVLANDERKFDIVEINLKDQSARVVESSKAPKLTKKIIEEKDKPIKVVEMPFDGFKWQVHVRYGVRLAVDLRRQKIVDAYLQKDFNGKPKQLDTHTRKARNEEVKRFMLASMLINPQFTYGDAIEGIPSIERQSQILINALWQAYVEVNFPIEDEIYQVTVLRGVPFDASILIGRGFGLYPLNILGKSDAELSDSEIEKLQETQDTQRHILVSSMITRPAFSYNKKGKRGAVPVEDLSEALIKTLFNAYRAVNVPEAGLDALRRFREMGGDRTGENPDNASL